MAKRGLKISGEKEHVPPEATSAKALRREGKAGASLG